MSKKQNDEPLFKDGVIGSWDQWAIHVIQTLKAQNSSMEDVEEALSDLKTDFLVFKTKIETRAIILGTIAGMCMGGLVAYVVALMTSI